MNYLKNNIICKLGMTPRTRRLFLSALLLSVVAFVCIRLSQPAEASVSVTRTGVAPNYTVTFTNDATAPVDNRLELHLNGANQLEYSVNGGAFTNNLGGGNTATFGNIATIVTNFGPGSNILVLNLQQLAFNASVSPDFANSQQTDTTLTDTGSGHSVTINTTSAKVIHFSGVSQDDNLTVTTGQGDSTARIDNAAGVFTDEVRATDLQPVVEFDNIKTFTYQDAGIGTNVVTFATQNLSGANSWNASLDNLDTLVIEGDDAINDNYAMTHPAAGQVRITDGTPSPPVTVTLNTSGGAGPPAVRVNGLGGNDTLNINVNSAVPSDVIPNQITFDGGAGNDLVKISGAPTTAVSNVILTPGPTAGEGHLRYNSAVPAQLMSIDFYNTEGVADTITAATMTANGTNASNAINYSAAQNVASGGRVAVDNFAPLEFSNKTNLVINTLAGSDLISINNPSTPAGLAGTISVNGGDPSANDTLIVNSETSNLVLEPTGPGAGTITYFGGGLPSTPFTNIGHLELVGTSTNPFGIDGTPGNDQFIYTPGATPDTGMLAGTMNSGVAQFPLVPITFIGMQQAGVVVFNAFGQQGGTDSFVFNGTPSDDNISMINGGVFGGVTLSDTVNGSLFANLNLNNMASATVLGNDGDDLFAHDGNVPIAVTYSGGNHSAGDVLNYNALNNAATTIDFGFGTINSTGSGVVSFIGIQKINETSSGASPSLTVNGTPAGDNITFAPTGTKAGTVILAGVSPLVSFTGLGTLGLNGLDGSDLFNITPSSTVTVNVNGGNPTPPASPGDQLNVNTAGTTGFSLSSTSTPSGQTGSFTFTNRLAVNFQQIETLSPLVVSAAPFDAIEGVAFSNRLVATFNAAAIAASNFSATINWGDGSSSSTGAIVANGSGGAFNVQGGHTYAEEGSYDVRVKVTDLTTGATQEVLSTATVADAPLSIAALSPGTNQQFTGVGGTNTSVTAGTANAALNAFKAAVGGPDNGNTASPQANGFRSINWDGVALDGTDFGGNSTVIVPNKIVGIPTNRFQTRGVNFDEIYAVSGDGFVSANPGVTGKFPAFSPSNTFAMFNDNTIDFTFVLPSAPGGPPIGAATRGFGAIFVNVVTPNSTSIEYFSGTTSLGKFFVPVGASGQAEFFGVLFQNSAVTNVHIVLGTATLSSFDGTNVTSGPADNPGGGTNLAATDDFVYAEPTSVSTGININAIVGAPVTAKVASFTDADSSGQLSDFSATINWGDSTTSAGTVTPNASGGFDVTGNHTYAAPGTFTITTSIRDVGGASISGTSTATVAGLPSLSINNVTVTEGDSGAVPATFTVTLTSPSSQAVTVDYFTSDGTATAPSDYQPTLGTLTFTPGQTTRTITVSVNGDLVPEPAETFFVNLMNPTNATITTPQGTGVIVDNASTGTFQFSSPSYSVGEGDLRVNLTVTRTGGTSGSATIGFATNDAAGLQPCNVFNGIASPRCDYENTIGTLQFAPGETSKSFSVAIIDDSYAEGNETFTVSLSNVAGATLGSPTTATVTIVDNDTTTGPNPIDTTNFFVRQHYLDFLGREPDPAGFAGWVNTINNCAPGDTSCDRIHVSQAFFQSDEFQTRGYFIYRFYPVSFGRKPDYSEFAPDLARVSGFLTPTQLEAAKVAFIADFISRPAFLVKYNALNNTQYVDTLLSTAGVTLSPPTRQAMIDGLNGATLTRAQVLRQIVESTEVSTKYFNEAFAVMEYFGYLRRDPDALYLNWITFLNSGGSSRAMVGGFMNSLEYRARFGP
jgi:hypothetical protein